MFLAALPLVASTFGSLDDTVVTTSPRSAQVRLADLLANADEIGSIRADHQTFTFSIERGGKPVELVVSTGTDGDVTNVVLRDRVRRDLELGSLSWLAQTMQHTVAVTRLTRDVDGAVTLTTDDGVRYMAIPGRGSGGNAEVEARWAAGHDADEG